MLLKISWLNVWRNKVRSLVVICSIALGIWAGIFVVAFSTGMMDEYVNFAIKTETSHIQIHNPNFKIHKKLKYSISGITELIKRIAAVPHVKAISARTLVNGMASSPTTGAGVTIAGVEPQKEDRVTGMSTSIIAGTYFKSVKYNPVVIGQKLATKLDVKVNNKIVLTFQDAQGNMAAGAFRIAGIFKSKDADYDETNLFVEQSDLNRILGLPPDQAHEIAVLLDNNSDKKLATAQQKIKKLAPSLLVENWKEISPDLQYIVVSLEQMINVFMVIILLALAFGIINTMLMAVLERTRELGILMAIGMNKTRVFFMIMFETLYLALIGGPVGLTLAYISVSYFGKKGIDLSAFSNGLSSLGIDTMIYTALPTARFVHIFLLIITTAFLSAIYPAIKALQLRPVDSIRKI